MARSWPGLLRGAAWGAEARDRPAPGGAGYSQAAVTAMAFTSAEAMSAALGSSA